MCNEENECILSHLIKHTNVKIRASQQVYPFNESKTLSKDWVISIRKIPNFHKMKCLCLFFVVIVPRISKKCQFDLIKFFKNPNLVTLHFVKWYQSRNLC